MKQDDYKDFFESAKNIAEENEIEDAELEDLSDELNDRDEENESDPFNGSAANLIKGMKSGNNKVLKNLFLRRSLSRSITEGLEIKELTEARKKQF